MESLRKCLKFGIYMSVLIPTNILEKNIFPFFLIKYDIFIYVFLSCEHRLPFLHCCTFLPWIIFFNFFLPSFDFIRYFYLSFFPQQIHISFCFVCWFSVIFYFTFSASCRSWAFWYGCCQLRNIAFGSQSAHFLFANRFHFGETFRWEE